MSEHSAGVIFDLDGVIIDSEELQFESYNLVLERYGIQVTREEYGREWIALGGGPEYAVRTYRLPIDAEELRQLKNPVYHQILRERVRLMPGVESCLARLGAHFPLAVATNSNDQDTTFVLDRFGIRERFAAVVTRDMYARGKPEPDAFLMAAARLDLPPSACAVVEDAYKGILAAHRAGCPIIAVPHDFTRDNDFSRATRIVRSLDDVTPDLVRELAGISRTV